MDTTYYILQPDDIIREGDEWLTDYSDGVWHRCGNSIGWHNQDYANRCDTHPGWQVRRKTSKTDLGNDLTD